MDVRKIVTSSCLGLSLLLMAEGCASMNMEAVRNVTTAPVYQATGPRSLDEVRDILVAGLADEDWGVIDQDQGWLLAQHEDGQEWARIRITYTATSYDIVHFDSSPSFKFDGKVIHENYNEWIADLDEELQDRFKSSVSSDDDDDDDDDHAAAPAAAPPATQPGSAEAIAAEPKPEPDASWNESGG
jgi:hypothetical protein